MTKLKYNLSCSGFYGWILVDFLTNLRLVYIFRYLDTYST